MKLSLKEKANQVLSRAGENIPGSRTSGSWWGEVELPECLRAELEQSDTTKKD